METTQMAQMYQGLTFLAWTTGVILIIVAVFLVKLFVDVSRLVRNINELTNIFKTEVEPTLKNLNSSMGLIAKMIKDTDEQVNKFKRIAEKFSGLSGKLFDKASDVSKVLSKGFFSGLWFVLKLFSKKK